MGELLSQCISVKTVCLFLLWARETEVLNVGRCEKNIHCPSETRPDGWGAWPTVHY